MFRKYLINISVLLLLLSFLKLSKGQEIPTMIPPSPDVASLGKYIDQPVSYYTGLPKIDIPIYEINFNGLYLPISLSYHASGLKVEDFASWVGAGWSLNAGGMVCRTIRGLPDEYEGFGYFASGVNEFFNQDGSFNPINCDDNPYNDYGNYCDFDYASIGGLDLQPDLFYYNIPGGSGKFVHDRNGNLHMIPFKPYDITAPSHEGPWQIKDGNGIIYIFSVLEGSTQELPYTFPPKDFCEREAPISIGGTNGWKLSKIISADKKDTIAFKYTPEIYTYETTPNETKYDIISGIGKPATQNTLKITTGPQRLEEIKSTAGHRIVFLPGLDREDLPGTKSLKRIEIYYENNLDQTKRIKYFELNTSYYGNKYLKLDSIKEYNGTGLHSKPAYTFDYHSMPSAINRDTKARDHWGYYNGKTNNETLIPTIELEDYILAGADREASDLAKSGVLETIHYPTGGATSYEYELNTYSNFDPEQNIVQVHHSTEALLDHNGSKTSEPIVFTETETVTFNCIMPEIIDGGIENYAIAEFRQISGGSDVITLSDNSAGNIIKYTIQPGTYEIYLDMYTPIDSDYIRVIINWYTETENLIYEKQAGGLRVKKIITTDNNPNTDDLIQNFKYIKENGVSSGKLMSFPKYFHIINWNNGHPVYGPLGLQNSCTDITQSGLLIQRSSHSNKTLGTVQGANIGYSRVEVYNGAYENVNGKTVYEYLNDQSYQSIGFPALPAPNKMYKNGLLIKATTYKMDNGGALKRVKEIENSYETTELLRIHGGAIAASIQTACVLCNNKDFVVANNYETSEKLYKTKTIEKTFGPNITDTLYKTTFYEYNDYLQVKRLSQHESNKDSTITYYYYPTDSPYSGGTIDFMRNNYIINPVIEKHEFKKITNGEEGIYGGVVQKYELDSNFLQKTEVYTLETKSLLNDLTNAFDGTNVNDSRFKLAVKFDYSSNNNINSIVKKDNIYTYYAWAYKANYPVIKIESNNVNLNIGAIQTAVNGLSLSGDNLKASIDTDIAKLKTAVGSTDGMISLYTYSPLVGMTSETDPNGKTTYYEYDDFSRLSHVRDHYDNILQKFDYNYQKGSNQEELPDITGFTLQSISAPVTVNPTTGIRTINLNLVVNNLSSSLDTCNITCKLDNTSPITVDKEVNGNSSDTCSVSWSVGPGPTVTKTVSVSGDIDTSIQVTLQNNLPNMSFVSFNCIELTEGNVKATARYENNGGSPGTVTLNCYVYKNAIDVPFDPTDLSGWTLRTQGQIVVTVNPGTQNSGFKTFGLENAKYGFALYLLKDDGSEEFLSSQELTVTTEIIPLDPTVEIGSSSVNPGEHDVYVDLVNASDCNGAQVTLSFVPSGLPGNFINPAGGITLTSGNCRALFSVTVSSPTVNVKATVTGVDFGSISSEEITLTGPGGL